MPPAGEDDRDSDAPVPRPDDGHLVLLCVRRESCHRVSASRCWNLREDESAGCWDKGDLGAAVVGG